MYQESESTDFNNQQNCSWENYQNNQQQYNDYYSQQNQAPQHQMNYPPNQLQEQQYHYYQDQSIANIQYDQNNSVAYSIDNTNVDFTKHSTQNDQSSIQTLDRNGRKKNREKKSITPCHNFKKKAKNSRQSHQQQQQNDSFSSRNSLASEMSHQFNRIDDQYVKWYQMLAAYYKQYYPEYKLPDPRDFAQGNNQVDYAAFCYQYYMQAQKQWTDYIGMSMMMPEEKKIPYLYHAPHIRANISMPGLLLQILPLRPSSGDPSRLELIAFDDIANESIVNVGYRASELVLQEKKENEISRNFESSMYASSTNASTGGISNQLDDEDFDSNDAKQKQAKICADITIAWDRLDNELFPGPLSAKNSLKLDLLAYLREKLNDIHERIPIDWESIVLFIKLLENLIKNNGVLQVGEISQILLEGLEPKDSSDQQLLMMNNSQAMSSIQNGHNQRQSQYINQSFDSHCDQNINDTMSQSMSQSMQPNGVSKLKRSDSVASSSLSELQLGQGAGNLQTLFRKLAIKGDRSQENKALEKFRQLLMNGLPVKAIEFACKAKLWGHAFALAQKLSNPNFTQVEPFLLQRVTKMFIASSVIPSDPLTSLYQILGGETPQIVNTITFSTGSDLSEWRSHLAMLISAKVYQPVKIIESIEKLGDSLLAKKLTFASHICYMISEQLLLDIDHRTELTWPQGHLLKQWSRLPGKIWLFGLTQPTFDMEAFDYEAALEFNGPHRKIDTDMEDVGVYPTECVQFTEIYEYCMKLRMQSQKMSPGTQILSTISINNVFQYIHLIPYKLSYSLRLVDAGMVDIAYRYLLSVGDSLIKFFYVTATYPPVSPYSQTDHVTFNINRDMFGQHSLRILLNMYRTMDICLNLLLRLQSHPSVDWEDALDELLKENYRPLPTSSERAEEMILVRILKRIHHELCLVIGIPSSWGWSLGVQTASNQQHVNIDSDQRNQETDHKYPQETNQPRIKQEEPQPTQQQIVQPQLRNPRERDSYNYDRRTLTYEDNVFATQHSAQQQSSFIPKTDLRRVSFTESQHDGEMSNGMSIAKQPAPLQEHQDESPSKQTAFFNPLAPSAEATGQENYFDYFSNVQVRSRNPSTSSHMSQSHSQNQARLSTSSIDDKSHFSPGPMTSPHLPQVNDFTPKTVQNPTLRPFTNCSTPNVPAPMVETKQFNDNVSTVKPVVEQKSNADSQSKKETNQQPEKQEQSDGWLGGIISKFSKKKHYLPDDSKNSIYYDDKLKKWVDPNDPDSLNDVPPPPTKPNNAQHNLTPLNDNQMPSPLATMPPSGAPILTGKTRSRYVNVLQASGHTNNQSASNQDIPIPP